MPAEKKAALTLPRLLMLAVIGGGYYVYQKYLGGPPLDGPPAAGSTDSGDVARVDPPTRDPAPLSPPKTGAKTGPGAGSYGGQKPAPSSGTFTPDAPETESEAAKELAEFQKKAAETAKLVAAEFKARRSDKQIEGVGIVHRELPDDNEGDRHQRFILKLADGATLLVSHNIDLAKRVPLEKGDRVEFNGEYEWSDPGGVIHWTHRNPARNPRHPHGWLRHKGKLYE